MNCRTQLLRPRVILPHIYDITPAFMDLHGLGGLLLDLDNTLIPYGSYDEQAEVTHWAGALQAAGYPLYLLSNARRERARVWAQRLGLPGVGLAGKPFAREYRRGLSVVNLPAHRVGMVGDQLFTDVLGGNWSGMFTIMVRPISDNALPHTRLARRLERLVLKRYGHDWAGKSRASQDGAAMRGAAPDPAHQLAQLSARHPAARNPAALNPIAPNPVASRNKMTTNTENKNEENINIENKEIKNTESTNGRQD